MGWFKRKFGDEINANIPPMVKKEINALYEMGIDTGMVYTDKDKVKRIVINYGYPQGVYTPDTEYRGFITRNEDTKEVVSDNREYYTPKAIVPDKKDGVLGDCFISFRTVKDWNGYIKIITSGNALHMGNAKIRKDYEKLGVVDEICSPSEFAALYGWKKGSKPLEGEAMPDTTPKNLTAEKQAEFDKMKAKLEAGENVTISA